MCTACSSRVKPSKLGFDQPQAMSVDCRTDCAYHTLNILQIRGRAVMADDNSVVQMRVTNLAKVKVR